jgi:hypothetical protein
LAAVGGQRDRRDAADGEPLGQFRLLVDIALDEPYIAFEFAGGARGFDDSAVRLLDFDRRDDLYFPMSMTSAATERRLGRTRSRTPPRRG